MQGTKGLSQFQPSIQGPTELEAAVRAVLQQVQSPKSEIQNLKDCVQQLSGLALTGLGADWKVRPFGSTVSGLRTRFSDLDVSCYQLDAETGLPKSPAHDHRRASDAQIQDVQTKLVPLLYQDVAFEVVEEVWAARIPIVRLRYKGLLDVDISFCNTEPFANTQLLKAYSKLNIKVRNLVMLVKLWAEGEHICGPKEGHLSSYALTLMTLYFLQVDEYIKMPCLPTTPFEGGKADSTEVTEVEWNAVQPLSNLLTRFFGFYASFFQWGQEVASIRTGQRLTIDNKVYKQLNGHYTSSRLHIEDPFLLHRNLNCVLQDQQEFLLWNKICEAWVLTQRSMAPAGLKVVHDVNIRVLAQNQVKLANVPPPTSLPAGGKAAQAKAKSKDANAVAKKSPKGVKPEPPRTTPVQARDKSLPQPGKSVTRSPPAWSPDSVPWEPAYAASHIEDPNDGGAATASDGQRTLAKPWEVQEPSSKHRSLDFANTQEAAPSPEEVPFTSLTLRGVSWMTISL